MKVGDLAKYWVDKHNEHYSSYLLSEREPRYMMKTFFLYSYHLFKTLKEGWGDFLVGYSKIFRRNPSNDYYGLRDPTDESNDNARKNSLEWVAAFAVCAEIGFPHNESAMKKFRKYSEIYLGKARTTPDSEWIDFFVSSAVAYMPEVYERTVQWFPSALEKYLSKAELTPHQLMIYLKATRNCKGQNELQEKALARLLKWIENPTDTYERQVTIWARLITEMQWLPELSNEEILRRTKENFASSLERVYSVDMLNSPMVLDACYSAADEELKKEILRILVSRLAPAKLIALEELFNFLEHSDAALEMQEASRKIREKCKSSVSQDECKACMKDKKGDCWIRILSKLTHTAPRLHSGYEVADKVVYSLQQGVYIVVKAEEIAHQTGEGDVLFRQCVTLFSVDHALVLYLNPFETAPTVIENIKKAASSSKNNPVFEVIDQKYVRQLIRKYLHDEKTDK